MFRKIVYDTDKNLFEITKKIEKLVKLIEQKKTLAEQIKKDISEIESKSKKIKKLGPEAECPTCERVLSDQYNALLKKFDSEKKNKENKTKSYLSDVKKNQQEKDSIIRQQTAFEKKKNYLQKLLREKERINAAVKHVSDEIKNEKTDIERKKLSLKKIGTIVFNEKEFENVKKQIEEVYKNYQKSLEVFNKQKDVLSALNLNIEKKQGEINLFDQSVLNLEEKINEIENSRKKIKEEKNAVKYLGMLSDIMSDFRTFLIARIRPTLSVYSSDFFSRLTDGKYLEVELDDNYDLMVYDNGEKYSIERFSGGEEDLANLCLRLAISEVITERAGGVFNFIILDEIFGSQDNIRRQNIMKALNSLSSKFRQIFLITHVEDVKNDMENIIYVVENEDTVSTAQVK